MSVDFFNSSCSENPINDSEFGLCDDENNTKAFTDVSDRSKWIATVQNDHQKSIQFTPIDNCMNIRKVNSDNLESTCDGMLTFDESIYLVELKNQKVGGWIPSAIKQLKNTIRILQENHPTEFTSSLNKKAFACNKKKAHFNVIEVSRKRKFYDETGGFRLDINTNIVVK